MSEQVERVADTIRDFYTETVSYCWVSPRAGDEALAEAILAALTPAPRTVETESEAQPGMVLRDQAGDVWQVSEDRKVRALGYWGLHDWRIVTFPCTVLYPQPTSDVIAQVRTLLATDMADETWMRLNPRNVRELDAAWREQLGKILDGEAGR